MNIATYNVGIIGLGQIGCSIGLALKEADICDFITGYDANPSHSSQAAIIGAVDSYCEKLEELIAKSNVIFICSPLHTMEDIFTIIGRHAVSGTVVTDAGSVKSSLMQMAHRLAPQCNFIPGHPIAGTEKSGPTNGDAELFRNKKMLFTPDGIDKDLPALAIVHKLWTAMGAKIEVMESSLHDRIYGLTSHLAQLLIYSYTSLLTPLDKPIKTSNSSFRQFTRIGGSDAIMWLDIFLMNRNFILDSAIKLSRQLELLAEKSAEGYSLEEYLTPIQQWRVKSRLMLRPEIWEVNVIGNEISALADILPLVIGYSYVATTMQEETAMDDSMYPFLGAGFNGVSLPAVLPPERAALLLSNHRTLEACHKFRNQLEVFCEAIAANSHSGLLNLINASKNQHLQNMVG